MKFWRFCGPSKTWDPFFKSKMLMSTKQYIAGPHLTLRKLEFLIMLKFFDQRLKNLIKA